MDSSYISLFRDSTPSFFQLSYLNYIELLSILLQKYNPVVTKTDIGGEKMKREDEIEDEIQYAYCMKFFERLKRIRYINKNTDAFLYVNLPHNRGMTSAQQLMDERTTADMQAHNSCCAVHDSILPNDRYYICQQLIPVLSTPMSMGTDDFSYSLRGIWWQ